MWYSKNLRYLGGLAKFLALPSSVERLPHSLAEVSSLDLARCSACVLPLLMLVAKAPASIACLAWIEFLKPLALNSREEYEDRLRQIPHTKLCDSELLPAEPVPTARLTDRKPFECHLVGHHLQTRLPCWTKPAMSLGAWKAPAHLQSFTGPGSSCLGASQGTTSRRVRRCRAPVRTSRSGCKPRKSSFRLQSDSWCLSGCPCLRPSCRPWLLLSAFSVRQRRCQCRALRAVPEWPWTLPRLPSSSSSPQMLPSSWPRQINAFVPGHQLLPELLALASFALAAGSCRSRAGRVQSKLDTGRCAPPSRRQS